MKKCKISYSVGGKKKHTAKLEKKEHMEVNSKTPGSFHVFD